MFQWGGGGGVFQMGFIFINVFQVRGWPIGGISLVGVYEKNCKIGDCILWETLHRKKTNVAVVFSSRPFPNILKYRNHR